MVHNGIEYGDMQVITEAYHFMRDRLCMQADEISDAFGQWNEGELNSYLIEITRDIMAFKDTDGKPLVDKILDAAGQKGTGKWTAVAALDQGIPLTLIGEAVFSRCLSAMKEKRVQASRILTGPSIPFKGSRKTMLLNLEKALYASKITSYAQGFTLLKAAADEYGWKLNYGNIALLWRGGCIIRSAFLGRIKEAFDRNPDLDNLLLDPFFTEKIASCQPAWRKVVAEAALNGIPLPALGSALAYYDGYRAADLPANLLQAQRDYFGAHQYERVDKPRGEFFHTNWTGRGGQTHSTTYTV
jgi:6-phosphogluconate dehydrogenase